jgi:hypothetical protein
MKYFSGICLGMILLFSGLCAGQSAEPGAAVNAFTIRSVQPAHGVYAVAVLEYPKAWGDDAKFTVEVNGKPVRSRKISGGFSGSANMADLMFFPRTAGKQAIAVKMAVNSHTAVARSVFEWKQIPFIAVMDHPGDREIVTGKGKQLVVAMANVADIRISFNGKDMYGRSAGSDVQARVIDPAWRQGKNTLTVSGNKNDGSIIVKNFTFFYLGEDGILPLGETVMFSYGREGSKSGPFYDVRVEGGALAPLRDARVPVLSMDNDGWLVPDTALAKEFRAQKPGRATIKVFIKPHFLEEMKLDRELTITVAQQ